MFWFWWVWILAAALSLYAFPRIIPPSKVRFVPSRLTFRWACSFLFVVPGHAFQISSGIRLAGLYIAFSPNLLLSSLSFSHASVELIYDEWMNDNRHTCCLPSTCPDYSECVVEIWMFLWWQEAEHSSIHFSGNISFQSENVALNMCYTETIEPCKVVIWTKVWKLAAWFISILIMVAITQGSTVHSKSWWLCEQCVKSSDTNLPSACPLCPSAMNESNPQPCMWQNAIGIPVSADAIEKIRLKRIKWAAAVCDVVNARATAMATHVNNLAKTKCGCTYTASVHYPKLPSQTLAICGRAWMTCQLKGVLHASVASTWKVTCRQWDGTVPILGVGVSQHNEGMVGPRMAGEGGIMHLQSLELVLKNKIRLTIKTHSVWVLLAAKFINEPSNMI